MKFLLIFMFFILQCSNSFGQSHEHQKISDEELKLFSDLNNALGSTSTIIFPFIESCIDLSRSDLKWLSNEFGFTNKQLSLKVTDTITLKNNCYFKVIDVDSILKFRNEPSCEIEKGRVIFEPFYYYTKQIYDKRKVRYFYRPIISRNGAFAIVQYDDNCGSLCGSGEILIMQQKNGKWRIIKVLQISIS